MGSIAHIFTAAMVLEHGQTVETPYTDQLSAESAISDSGSQGSSGKSLGQMFITSRSDSWARVGLELGSDLQRTTLKRLGMLSRISTEIPGAAYPLIDARDSASTSTMKISSGSGLAVSPLQLLAGVNSVINGGVVQLPTLLTGPSIPHVPPARVFSETTSSEMRKLLRSFVKNGPRRAANVDGYSVGGKSAVITRVIGGQYVAGRVLSVFVAVFPIYTPQYALLVALEDPAISRANARMFPAERARIKQEIMTSSGELVSGIISKIAPLLRVDHTIASPS
jgi:cell division protein FtsI (penicillin-binding protein 3)